MENQSILSDQELKVDGVIYRELKTLNHVVTPGVAHACLFCRPNSHPFNDRTLDLPVKVGRSDARAGATQTNAIFDSKVSLEVRSW